VHSGDSACAIPPYSLPPAVIERLVDSSRRLAESLKVRGLMNVQYAITRPHGEQTDYEIYVLEVNPRASRTVPFVSKATGVSWARIAAKAMAGCRLADLGVAENFQPAHTAVKESVFPFAKFPGVDVILGPEMRSTGEVMGVDRDFAVAFAKSQMAAGGPLPDAGSVFLSVRESDKPAILDVARQLLRMGFALFTTGGTHRYLADHGVTTERLSKISEGRPHAIDMIKNHELALIINTPTRKGMKTDEGKLRATAVRYNVPMITTTTAAAAAVRAIAALRTGAWSVRAMQDYYPQYQTGAAPAVTV
jgi:carbamoyl-phosphate synthase large subunit